MPDALGLSTACDIYGDRLLADLDHRKFVDMADACIVGAGAAGGVAALELAKAGLSVVVIESGPYWDPQDDFVSDELEMEGLLGWTQTRLTGGSDPLKLGHNNSGWGVGGGTTHFTGVFLRFHASDFATRTRDGVGIDWPIAYDDLAPEYDELEREIAVSGPRHFPWGEFHGPYPYPVREPISANSQLLRKGCEAMGVESSVAPLAILSASFEGRPPCTSRGFCNQGCMTNAKFSTLIHHIPKAIDLGAEILPNCTATRLETDDSGLVKGVAFVHKGEEHYQRARVFLLCGFVVETPRLLLASADNRFPHGLANSSGMVGRCIMPHSGHDVFSLMEEEVRFYKGPPVMATTGAFYETDHGRGFARGYMLHAHGHRPVSFAKSAMKFGYQGKDLRRALMDYNHYAGIAVVGEVLPNPDNRVALHPSEKDENGVPRAVVSFSYCENDKRLIDHAVSNAKEILEAVGGTRTFVSPDTAHLMGGCRMGKDPGDSVVDGYGRSHDIGNLFITGAPILPTGAGCNPTETVMALAKRTSKHIVSMAKQGGV